LATSRQIVLEVNLFNRTCSKNVNHIKTHVIHHDITWAILVRPLTQNDKTICLQWHTYETTLLLKYAMAMIELFHILGVNTDIYFSSKFSLCLMCHIQIWKSSHSMYYYLINNETITLQFPFGLPLSLLYLTLTST
jgi:hypothetical protein